MFSVKWKNRRKVKGEPLLLFFFSPRPTSPVRAFLRTVFLRCLGPRAMDRHVWVFFFGTFCISIEAMYLYLTIYLQGILSIYLWYLMYLPSTLHPVCTDTVRYGSATALSAPQPRWSSAPPLIGCHFLIPGSPLPGTSE